MSDLPLNRKSKKTEAAPPADKPEAVVAQPVVQEQNPSRVEVTHDNADLLSVHFLSQIYSRLGYMVKLLEEKK